MNSSIKFFDCAIITVLREEMKLFLEKFKNNIFIIEKKQNYTTFYFCDKNNNVRTGIIYNIGNAMGNSEACRLMYEFTRNYKADVFINVGIACSVNDVNIGDVILVSECYSLSENNSSRSNMQKTSLQGYDDEYIKNIFNNINDDCFESFKAFSKDKIENIESSIKEKIKSQTDQKIALKFFKEKSNSIALGKCATVPQVVKDKETYDKIKEIRKCNILEMEAYYLALWHSIIKRNEPDKIDGNSQFIILKSPSDDGKKKSKNLLEKIGARQLAMSNLSFLTKYLMEEVIDFNNTETLSIPEFINNKYNAKSIDSFTQKNYDKNSFNNLCSYLIKEKTEDYFEYAKNILKNDGAILTIYGPAGTGKSTFFSYLYNELKSNNYCIYIDIAKIIKYGDTKSIDICLYLIERMMRTECSDDIIILFDGFGKKLEAPSDFIINTFNKISRLVSLKSNQRISFCVNDLYNNKIESKYLPDFFSTYSINFTNVSIIDDNFENFIKSFYDYSKNIFQLPDNFTSNVIKIIKNSEIQCIDFRLLKTIAEEYRIFINAKSFHGFIVDYCKKYTITPHDLMNISKLIYNDYYKTAENRSFEMLEIPRDYASKYKQLSQNIYTNAYLLSMNIWNMCGLSKSDIDTYDFLISKNINSFLAYCIKTSNADEVNKKVQNILTKAMKNIINKSASIQLMYIFSQKSIFRMFSNNTKKMFRVYVEERAKNIFNEDNNTSYLDIMEQRTMSIIMNVCFADEKYLREYNEKMIKHIDFNELNDYLNYNIAFHILYYSQENYSFCEIENATVNANNSVLINYAYNAISLFLQKYFSNDINQFYIMNFITLLYIYKCYINDNEELNKNKNECKHLIEDIMKKLQEKSICNDSLLAFYNNCIYNE